MKQLIPVIIFAICATGCAGIAVQSNNDSSVYGNQQISEERTPMERWVEMREESEVKEVDDVKWLAKMKQMEARTAAETKKQPRTKIAKNKKFDKSGKKQEGTGG